MFNYFKSISIILLVGFIWGQRSQQDFEKELKAQSSAIESLRNEIEETKKRIQSEDRKEKSTVRKVSNLSEEISLLQRLVKEIDKEERLLVADITRTENQILKSEVELDTLRARYARRLNKIYKRGELTNQMLTDQYDNVIYDRYSNISEELSVFDIIITKEIINGFNTISGC